MISGNEQLATLIYNPLAGMMNVQPALSGVINFWNSLGWEVDVKATRYAGHARDLAIQAVATGRRMILVAGGDGTLGEVAAGMINSECILAPLPSGTGNSFAKELALPLRRPLGKRDLLRACQALADGQVRPVDMGVCNEEWPWLQWTGIGADGHIIARIEPRTRSIRRLGSIGYIALGLLSLSDYDGVEAEITVDGKEFQGHFIMITITNCRRYAGGQIILNPDAVLDDGLFEVRMFEGRGKRALVRYIVDLFLRRHNRNPRNKMVRGKKIEVTAVVPSPIHHDGDPAGFTPLRCRLAPHALRLLVPSTAPIDLFQGNIEPMPE